MEREILGPDVKPAVTGVYWAVPIDENGDEQDRWGYAYFDATDRIWGCNQATIDEAWMSPEFEFATQTKRWQPR